MRFRCCPPAKAGGPAAAGAKKGGSSLSRSTSGGAKRPGAKTGLKRDPKRNPLADVDCDDEGEEEIARAFAEGFNLAEGGVPEGGVPGESPPASPVSDPAAGPPRLCQEAPETLKARTLIILDWDDTLLTTTRLTSRHSVFGPGGTSIIPAKPSPVATPLSAIATTPDASTLGPTLALSQHAPEHRAPPWPLSLTASLLSVPQLQRRSRRHSHGTWLCWRRTSCGCSRSARSAGAASL